MKLLLSVASIAVASMAHAFTLIPNGDFEALDDSLTWVSANGGGDTVFSYPDTGGNGGGFASINNTGGWAVLVSPPEAGAAGGGITISSLGLTAGNTYDFQMDMINLSGTGVGGLKVEAWAGNALIGNSGDMAASGQSASWATYTWSYTLPLLTEKLIIVPLWGNGSNIGFDNVGVVGGAIPEPSSFAILAGLASLGFVASRRRR